MTPTTPSPTARDVTEARALSEHVRQYFGLDEDDGAVSYFAEMFAAALAERERETVESDCKAVCGYCKSDKPVEFRNGIWQHRHSFVDDWVRCYAQPIRAAARRENETTK